MTPDMVLPIFLGVCLAGNVVWNVILAGQKHKLEVEVEQLWDDLTVAVKKIPVQGKNGRFQKRSA